MATLNLSIVKGTTSPVVLIHAKDAVAAAVPLAGWAAFAQVRRNPDNDLLLDLVPVIDPSDSAGLITIPAIAWSATAALPDGVHQWDLILQNPAGLRYPPILSGSYTISAINTQHT